MTNIVRIVTGATALLLSSGTGVPAASQGLVTPLMACSPVAVVGEWSGFTSPFTTNFTFREDGTYTYSVSEGLEELLSTRGTFVLEDRVGAPDRNWPSNCSLILRTREVVTRDETALKSIRKVGSLMDEGRERRFVLDNVGLENDDGRRRVLTGPVKGFRMTLDAAVISSGGAQLKRER